ncbi:hypothetical protein L1F30_07675 [Simiduia sp. 21SJ11W-1]|uniref:hypothetical protein n=1 Tax=Simiduia sp. 21SJ11W-1 TaxID=2909669 RepID=UPI00209E7978|nr:hypothetical protein [Simiduia sp. 21SJ11W-1]UTA49406.1 hypothetical protein L1F30_07675 [Simiduia sp. 21SJ11W-1]
MKHLLLLLAIVFAPALHAEEIRIPVGQQGIDGLTLPTKGQTMTQVESKFGAAEKQHPARGNPPITRWEYSNFMVYFEGEHVIHAVLRHQPKAMHKTPTPVDSPD